MLGSLTALRLLCISYILSGTPHTPLILGTTESDRVSAIIGPYQKPGTAEEGHQLAH